MKPAVRRPKVPPRHLRRTVAAIIWRHENAAMCCAIPAELGPWWMAAQTLNRWSRLGVWERLLTLAQEAAGAPRGSAEALGRSRGGIGTKACVIADSAGRAVVVALAPGRAHAVPLLARLPDMPLWVVGDRGYSSHAFRQYVWSISARPALPSKRNEAPIACLN